MESARVKDFLPDPLLDRLEAPLGEATGLPNVVVAAEFSRWSELARWPGNAAVPTEHGSSTVSREANERKHEE